MLEKYSDINLEAKKYLVEELENKFHEKNNNEKLLDRCHKELDLLCEKGLLFIIKYLYDLKKLDENISYHFHGNINNLYVLYILGISRVDAIKYNLPYELFTDKTINVDLVDNHPFELVWFIESQQDCKVACCYHDKEEIKEIDELLDEQYMLIPTTSPTYDMLFRINEYGMFETVDDYRKYADKYIVIKIDTLTTSNLNILQDQFETKISKMLNPKTFDDYVKIKSISKGTNTWKCNQDELVKSGKINIDTIIANREDIYDYLLKHNVDDKQAIDIIKFINKSYDNKKNNRNIWNKYVDVMKQHGCDEQFIEIISKIAYISNRGELISKYLLINQID